MRLSLMEVFKLAPQLYSSFRDDLCYVKNLYSPVDGILKLDKESSTIYKMFLTEKEKLPIFYLIKFLLLDIILLPWRKQSNYNINKINKTPHLFSFWIHMTNNCNLACKYCYIHQTTENLKPEVIEQFPQLVKDLRCKGYKKIRFKFAGGEPLLRFDQLKEMYTNISKVAIQQKLKTEFFVISNGTIMNYKIIDFFKQNINITLVISLDGLGKTHDKNRIFKDGSGSFNTVYKNLQKLASAGVKPQLNITVTESNVEDLPQLYSLIHDLGLNFNISLARENNCTFTQDQFNEEVLKKDNDFILKYQQSINLYKKYLHKDISVLSIFSDRAQLNSPHFYPCGIERNYAVVDTHGNIHKCQMLISDNTATNSIFNKDWVENIKKPSHRTNIPINKKVPCKDCLWKYYCSGGCPVTTEFVNKSSKSVNPNCNLYKDIFPKILELEIDRLHKFQ